MRLRDLVESQDIVFEPPNIPGLTIFDAVYDPVQRIALIDMIESRGGAGRQAVTMFEQWARQQGAQSVQGMSFFGAIGFWEKMGYKIGPETEDGYSPIKKILNVTETFDTSQPTKFEHGRNRMAQSFEVDGRTYYVTFLWRSGRWDMLLSLGKPTLNKMKKNDDVFAPTGKGGAFAVMGTVIHILHKFLARFRPAVVAFTTKHAGLEKLYWVMLHRYADSLKRLGYAVHADGGFRLERMHDMVKEDTDPLSADLPAFAAQVKQQFGLKEFRLYITHGGAIKLDMLAAEPRKTGKGTAAMEELCRFADQHGRRIVLDVAQPDYHWGTTSAARLRRFYSRFGFVRNFGRTKDYALSASMYRDPRGQS